VRKPVDVIGRQLGSYQILAPLGAGGMGEVYRAHDTKLGRDVAVKILPSHFTGDPDRRARLVREARLLATLNHPNIGAIYGLEEADGLTALVLELVEGQTLSQRLEQGPLRRCRGWSLHGTWRTPGRGASKKTSSTVISNPRTSCCSQYPVVPAMCGPRCSISAGEDPHGDHR
jgi:serine/threonine protein kinase